MINYLNDFNRGMTINDYKELLEDQLSVYELHFKKAVVADTLNLPDDLKILIITEPWCGDSTAILPVLQKLFMKSNIEIRILRRDENPDLIDSFLTNGGRAIPIVVVLDKKGNYLGHCGPRPSEARAIFDMHRTAIKNGDIEKSDVIRKIRTFYAKDKGSAILNSFLRTLNNALSDE
ncbi:MAG: thioredoxin family protein [Calditrichaceae bacterium]|nr:thioredoxin family protein [Calditrichaceae bacterium]